MIPQAGEKTPKLCATATIPARTRVPALAARSPWPCGARGHASGCRVGPRRRRRRRRRGQLRRYPLPPGRIPLLVHPLCSSPPARGQRGNAPKSMEAGLEQQRQLQAQHLGSAQKRSSQAGRGASPSLGLAGSECVVRSTHCYSRCSSPLHVTARLCPACRQRTPAALASTALGRQTRRFSRSRRKRRGTGCPVATRQGVPCSMQRLACAPIDRVVCVSCTNMPLPPLTPSSQAGMREESASDDEWAHMSKPLKWWMEAKVGGAGGGWMVWWRAALGTRLLRLCMPALCSSAGRTPGRQTARVRAAGQRATRRGLHDVHCTCCHVRCGGAGGAC